MSIRNHTMLIIGILSFLALAPVLHAQSVGRLELTNSNLSSYHYHVQRGGATVQVQVLGTVRLPGLYEIDAGLDVGTLLALSGPVMNPRQYNLRRRQIVRLYRSQSPRQLVYEASLDDTIADTGMYPVLQDGDVLVVETLERTVFVWRDAVTIVGAVASLALAVDRFNRATR